MLAQSDGLAWCVFDVLGGASTNIQRARRIGRKAAWRGRRVPEVVG